MRVTAIYPTLGTANDAAALHDDAVVASLDGFGFAVVRIPAADLADAVAEYAAAVRRIDALAVPGMAILAAGQADAWDALVAADMYGENESERARRRAAR